MAAECNKGGCGVVAVGRCVECDEAFCGSHQAMIDSPGSPSHGNVYVDLCSWCLAARVTAASNAAADEDLRLIAALEAIADPIERLVVAAKSLARNIGRQGDDQFETWSLGREDLFRRACDPQLYEAMNDGRGSRVGAFWTNGAAIAGWFARRALTSGHLPTDRRSPGTETYGFRHKKIRDLRPVDGWVFEHGSASTYRIYDGTFCHDALVTSDGALHPSDSGGVGRLRLGALVEMADRLRFAAVT